MDQKTIYLLRHGQTDFNKRGVVQGRGIDAPLNEVGRKQAASFFSMYGEERFDHIYISMLQRTYQTVEGFIQLGIPFTRLEGLDEIDWGKWEGSGLSKEGREYYRKTLQKWQQGETDLAIEGGESPDRVQARQKVAMNHILRKENESRILICMHGRALRILLPLLLDLPLRTMEQFPHENTSLYKLVMNGNGFEIVERNNLRHLDAF